MSGATRRTFIAGGACALTLAPTTAARAKDAEFRTFSDGSLVLPASLLSPDASPEAIRAALAEAGLPEDVHAHSLNVSALLQGKDVILFDCGAGQNLMEGAGKLVDSLAQAGVSPEQVRHVAFTHAHPDHLWGALDDFDTPAFPNATYHLPAAERDFWFGADVYKQLPEDRHAFAAGAQRILRLLEPVLKTFRPGDEIAPGVASFEAGGHTPGHVGFDVRVGSEILTVVGDALTHAAISFRHPDWAGGFDHDPARAVATRKRLLDRLAGDGNRFVGYHLPQGGTGRVERAGAAWRFVPEG